MEHTLVEVRRVEEVALEAESPIQELDELQLVLVGGGCGETIAH